MKPIARIQLDSVQIGKPRDYSQINPRSNKIEQWTTSFNKTSVKHWVSVTANGIDGDEQADKKNHGGIDKAVLIYSADHFDYWRNQLGVTTVAPGAFGENLTVSGIDESKVCLGDQFLINDVLLEVSQPRQPCWKLARHWRLPELPKQVMQTGYCGWYCRVIKNGRFKPETPIARVTTPHPEWPIRRAHQVFHQSSENSGELNELLSLAVLSSAWKTSAEPGGDI
ncbi:MAG: MOSC domain-containing protein [Planctomycetaceae bacterium]|nr:MOSC domain-containing protein [Planctomycetaceae bacterium]MCP4479211.1 MOSC domain-containing protein [Planctomycetaceae bacterium]